MNRQLSRFASSIGLVVLAGCGGRTGEGDDFGGGLGTGPDTGGTGTSGGSGGSFSATGGITDGSLGGTVGSLGGSTGVGNGPGTAPGTGGSTCTSSAAADPDCWVNTESIPGTIGAYAFGDGTSTMSLYTPAPGTVCMRGVLAHQCGASCNYALWGAGFGLPLAVTTPSGIVSFDATAFNPDIEKVMFSIENPPSSGVRPMLNLVAALEQAFFFGDPIMGFTTSVTGLIAPFAGFVQPPWGNPDLAWDPTDIHSLQFTVVSSEATAMPYDFCISGIQFLSASNRVVDVPVPMQ